MIWLTKFIEKAAAIGTVFSAMGCASCFPALGGLAAALGMGFLAQFESSLINLILPIAAGISLLAYGLDVVVQRRWLRGLIGMSGPAMVLLTLYPLWSYSWSTYLFYAGLVLMSGFALWDLFRLFRPGCSPHSGCRQV